MAIHVIRKGPADKLLSNVIVRFFFGWLFYLDTARGDFDSNYYWRVKLRMEIFMPELWFLLTSLIILLFIRQFV